MKRGKNGSPPLAATNVIDVFSSVQVYAYELSFDAMSPYILIHGKGCMGSGATNSFWNGMNPGGDRCWRGMADEFEFRDIPFDDSISLSYYPPADISQESIQRQAQELGAQPATLAAEFGTRHVNFICHSKGGLDTREWLTTVKPIFAPNLVVGQFITLATPHRGSVIADYAVNGSALTEGEILVNTGVDISLAPWLVNPRDGLQALKRMLTLNFPTKYPILVVGPKIAKMLRGAGMAVADPASNATVNLQVANAVLFSHRNFPLLAAYTNPDGTKPAFWALRADADLNSNGKISLGEMHYVSKYDLITGMFADFAYGGLRDIRSVQLSGALGTRLVVENWTASPELNDFLVGYSSAFPDASYRNVFVLAGTVKRDHGTIADHGMGLWLYMRGFVMPRRK